MTSKKPIVVDLVKDGTKSSIQIAAYDEQAVVTMCERYRTNRTSVISIEDARAMYKRLLAQGWRKK